MTIPGLFWYSSISDNELPYDGPLSLAYSTGYSGSYISFSPDKTVAFITTNTNFIRVDMLTKACTTITAPFPPLASSGSFTPDGIYFYAQSAVGHIYKIVVATGELTTISTDSTSGAYTNMFTPDGLYFIQVYEKFLIKLSVATNTWSRTDDMSINHWPIGWSTISSDGQYFYGYRTSSFSNSNHVLVKVNLSTMAVTLIALPTYSDYGGGGFFSQNNDYLYFFHGAVDYLYKVNVSTDVVTSTLTAYTFAYGTVRTYVTYDYTFAYIEALNGYIKLNLSDDTYIQILNTGGKGLFSPDNQYFMNLYDGSSVKKIDIATNAITDIALHGGSDYPLYNYQFISNNIYLIVTGGSTNGMISKIDMLANTSTQYFGTSSNVLANYAPTISPDGTIILSLATEAVIRGLVSTMTKTAIPISSSYYGNDASFNSSDTIWFTMFDGDLYIIDR